MRKCVLLLPKIAEKQIWKKKGCESIYVYAAKLAGMSHSTVDDALRILKKIEDKPELQKVVEERGLNAVRPVVAIATQQSAAFWAKNAMNMSKNTLEVFVREIRKNGLPETSDFRTSTWQNTAGESDNSRNLEIFEGVQSPVPTIHKKVVAMDLEPEIIEKLEKLKGQGGWNDLMQQLLMMREQQFEAQKPEPVTEIKPGNCSKLSRYIPAKIKNYLIENYNGQCAFSHCKQPYQIIHHTQRWALQHIHNPDKMAPLCKGHERLVHLGLVENEELQPKFWKIRTEPDKYSSKFKIDLVVQKFRTKVP